MSGIAQDRLCTLLFLIVGGMAGCSGRDVLYPGTNPPPEALFGPALVHVPESAEFVLPANKPLILQTALRLAVERHPELDAAAATIMRRQWARRSRHQSRTVW